MKKYLFSLLALCLTMPMVVACDDDDTYADMLKRERKQISAFLSSGVTVLGTDGTPVLEVPGNIQVISEEQFYAQDSLTDVSKNEYVLFSGSGVYMQIVRKGQGQPLADGEHATVLSRYIEYNIASDTIQSSNRNQFYVPYPETMSCTNSGGIFTGTFTSGAMLNTYSTASVPSGWLIPLAFINLPRFDNEEGPALVRLIVPAAQGQSDASYNIYPCFYEISYMRGRE